MRGSPGGLPRLTKATCIVALAAGLLCMGEAAWIHAKAGLAQMLIGAAWRRELTGAMGAKPWGWADTQPVARLQIGEGASARVFIVLEGASGRNLAFGPAHDSASVLPGQIGNSVIEGHRDTHFAALRGVKRGDVLRVDTVNSNRASFVVTDVRVTDSRSTRIVLVADRPRLTLVTCYPFDAVVPGGPLRWVVTADEVT